MIPLSPPLNARFTDHTTLVQGWVSNADLFAVVDQTVAAGHPTDAWLKPWLHAGRADAFLYALPHANDVEQGAATLLMQAIMLACEAGHAMLKGLLQAGADLHQRNLAWDTPLHISAYTGPTTYAVIPVLLEHGADRLARNRLLQTPLLCAVNSSYAGMPDDALQVLDLLGRDAPSAVWCDADAFGQTPFSMAMDKGPAVQRALILAGAGVSLHVGRGSSPWAQAEHDPLLKARWIEWIAEAATMEADLLRRHASDPAVQDARPHRPRL